MQELHQTNNQNSINMIMNIKYKQHSLENKVMTINNNLANVVRVLDKLNKDSQEYKANITTILEKIKDFDTHIGTVQEMKYNILSMSKMIEKLDTTLDKNFEKLLENVQDVNDDIIEINKEIEKIPLIYQKKSSHTFGDILKMAPSLLTIGSIVLGIFILYLKEILKIGN